MAVSFFSDSEFSQMHQNCKCRYRIKTLKSATPAKNNDSFKNLLLDRIDPLVIDNKIIELHHTLLCAAIPRESNNTNENKTLRILNQAYADLMIQRSTLKPLGTDKYAQQLHDHIFCVEHTGSFSVYTLEDYTNTFHNEIKKLPIFLNGKQRPVNGNTGVMLSSMNYDAHITIYSSGTIHIQGVKALFIGNLIKTIIARDIIPKLPSQYDKTKYSKHYGKCTALFPNTVQASSPLPSSLMDTDSFQNSSFSSEIIEMTPELTSSSSLSCPSCPKLVETVSRLVAQVDILTAKVKVLETRRPSSGVDTNLEIIKADIQKVDDHFSACLARTDSVVASLVDELEQLLPSPREKTPLLSPVSKMPRVLGDIDSPPQNQTDHSPNTDNPSNQSNLTSTETQTTPNTSSNTSANSTSQHNTKTQTPQTASNSDHRSSSNSTNAPPNQHQNTMPNNNRWNNVPSDIRQAPQRPLLRSPNKNENQQTNRDTDRMRTVLIDDIDIDHYRTLKTDGDIRKAIFINHRSVVIDTITRVGRNKPKLLIKLKDANMAYELVQMWKETTFTKSKAQINPKSSTNNNIIGIARGIPLDATDEQINEDLADLYEGAKASRLISHSGPMRAVKIVFKTRQDLEHAIIFSIFLEKIGVNCAVEESRALNIIQCYNCWCLGHTSRICANKRTCCNCGSSSCEDMERCHAQSKCSNCSGNHKANDRECPKYQQVKTTLLKRHG